MWDRCRDYLSCGTPRKVLNGLTVLAIGLGIVIFALALVGAWDWQWGLVGMITLWAIGGAVRAYLVTPEE